MAVYFRSIVANGAVVIDPFMFASQNHLELISLRSSSQIEVDALLGHEAPCLLYDNDHEETRPLAKRLADEFMTWILSAKPQSSVVEGDTIVFVLLPEVKRWRPKSVWQQFIELFNRPIVEEVSLKYAIGVVTPLTTELNGDYSQWWYIAVD